MAIAPAPAASAAPLLFFSLARFARLVRRLLSLLRRALLLLLRALLLLALLRREELSAATIPWLLQMSTADGEKRSALQQGSLW